MMEVVLNKEEVAFIAKKVARKMKKNPDHLEQVPDWTLDAVADVVGVHKVHLQMKHTHFIEINHAIAAELNQ